MIRVTLYSCYTGVVPRRLKNVTITLEEDVARWARIEAARQDTSVSQLLGEVLKQRMSAEEGYEAAMERALKRRPFFTKTSRYLTRDEAHDRARLR